MGPYRLEHFIHLELQWAMWLPLTFWAVHRLVDRPSWRTGVIAGLFLWLQMLSSVYYGVYLTIILLCFVPLLLLLSERVRIAPALQALALAAVIAVALTLPYAAPYIENARTLGRREETEVATYSATALSYFTASEQNWVWGWTSRWKMPELVLFPGLIAILLAIAAGWYRGRRAAILYAGITVLAIELSLGMNGFIYRSLLEHVPALQGLRAPARFGIFVICGIAMLAGLGTQVVQERLSSRFERLPRALVPSILALMIVDYAPRDLSLTEVAPDPPIERNVYTAIHAMGPGVVTDLPVPDPTRLPGYDPWYAFWSHSHWHPLVNGYSGYYPPDYIVTLTALLAFPDGTAVRRLRELSVTYVVVHRSHYPPAEFLGLVLEVAGHRDFRHLGTYRAPSGEVELFLLRRGTAA
jgi:hypothetical protein